MLIKKAIINNSLISTAALFLITPFSGPIKHPNYRGIHISYLKIFLILLLVLKQFLQQVLGRFPPGLLLIKTEVEKMKVQIAIVLLFLSSIPMAAAQEEKKDYLEARYEKIACGIDFRTEVLEMTSDKVQQASNLKHHVNTLSEDRERLEALADEGSVREFREYVRETLRPHMADAKEDLKKDWEKFDQWKVSEETIAELREEYEELRGEFKGCKDEAVIPFGEAKAAWYEAILEKKQEQTQRLSEKGVDTAEMNEIISGAGERIANPLKDALGTEDPETVKHTLRTYRLFNGGNESTISYHFAAKYQVARLGGVLDFIAPRANDAGYGDMVTSIQDTVDATEGMLADIGDKKYAPGEGEDVWSSIKHGFAQLRELRHLLRSKFTRIGDGAF